jgi:hypothetical protein
MSTTKVTVNDLFNLTAEMVADIISAKPGVLSIRSTDHEIRPGGEIIRKELLVTCSNDLFQRYLHTCQLRHGFVFANGDDVGPDWLEWRAWNKEDLARFVLDFSAATKPSFDDSRRFRELMADRLDQHAVLRMEFTLIDLELLVDDIDFVLAPENIADFAEAMHAMRAEYQVDTTSINQYDDGNGKPVFTQADFDDFDRLQAGHLFDLDTKKFAHPAN